MQLKTISIIIIILSMMFLSGCKTPEPRDYVKTETKVEKEKRMQWWRDAKFGMFIHWGGYSQLGGIRN